MDDERLLAEALRAHAAGGVSTPQVRGPATGGQVPRRAETAAPGDETAGPAGPGRFRPATGPAPGAPHPTGPAPGPRGGPGVPPPAAPHPGPGLPPGPRPPTPPRAWTGPATPGGGRPVPAPPPRPGVPAPPAPGPAPPAPAPHGEAGWTARRVAWWSGVALLGGAVAGALGGVITLLVP